MTQKQNTHQHLTNLDGRNYRNDNKCTGPQSCMGHTFVGNWSQNNVVSFFYTRLLLQAQCDPVPPMWGYSSIFAAQGKVDRRNRFAQVLASMPDAGPIAPTGLGHWTPLRVPSPQDQVHTRFHGHSTKGNLYTYTHILDIVCSWAHTSCPPCHLDVDVADRQTDRSIIYLYCWDEN